MIKFISPEHMIGALAVDLAYTDIGSGEQGGHLLGVLDQQMWHWTQQDFLDIWNQIHGDNETLGVLKQEDSLEEQIFDLRKTVKYTIKSTSNTDMLFEMYHLVPRNDIPYEASWATYGNTTDTQLNRSLFAQGLLDTDLSRTYGQLVGTGDTAYTAAMPRNTIGTGVDQHYRQNPWPVEAYKLRDYFVLNHYFKLKKLGQWRLTPGQMICLKQSLKLPRGGKFNFLSMMTAYATNDAIKKQFYKNLSRIPLIRACGAFGHDITVASQFGCTPVGLDIMQMSKIYYRRLEPPSKTRAWWIPGQTDMATTNAFNMGTTFELQPAEGGLTTTAPTANA